MSETTLFPRDPASGQDDGFAFEFSGGDLALDFTNTISRRKASPPAGEKLLDYGRLVSWAHQARLLESSNAARLRAAAKKTPRAAAAALKRAVAVREAIYAVLSSVAAGARPPREAVDALNAAMPASLAALRILPQRQGFAWRFESADGDLAPMLAPVVRAAAELLTSQGLGRVRECGSDTCSWLFLDRSKNGTRRWCDMKSCGNRAKARRYYQREKKAAEKRPTGE